MLVLEWKCTNIYASDIELLDPPNWFNDNIINFCCDYLQHITFYGNNSIKFVHPGTCFVIMNEDEIDILKDTIESCGINKNKSLIFFPINNSSHWNLILYQSKNQKYYIFDSIDSLNRKDEKDNLYIKKFILIISKYLSENFDINVDIIFIKSSLQTNDYDCGCYMTMNMMILAERIMNGSEIDTTLCKKLIENINDKTVTNERNEIKKRIFNINKIICNQN